MSLREREHRKQITSSTDLSGSSNAASVKLGYARRSIDIYYDFSASNGDITVEVSEDGSNWRTHYTEASSGQTTGGAMITDIPDTTYTYARVYYGGNDSDVTTLEISGAE